MKICLVTETFPPEINGVAKTLHRISHDLKVLGHSVTIVRPHQSGEAKVSQTPYYNCSIIANSCLPWTAFGLLAVHS